jgi:sugar/nucleoside kinase (ribokinase family)
MLTNRGAGGRISADDWSPDLLDGVRHLHLSGYTLFAEPGLQLARLAMAAASSLGLTISVDPASTGFLRDFGIERFLTETAPAGLIIPNRDEALLLTGAATPQAAASALSLRYGTAVVKLGAEGAILATEGRVTAATAGRERDVIDSTGAGDAFAAGFLTARLRGGSDLESLEAGCSAGADAVAIVGGRPRYGLGSNRLYPIHTD